MTTNNTKFEKELLFEFENKIISKIIIWINKATEYLAEIIRQNTPIDTWKLIDNWEIKKAIMNNTEIVSKIENDTSYGKFVEWGVRWRIYNYYKRRWAVRTPYYSGVWAEMMERAVQQNEKQVYDIIKKETWL